MAQECDVQYKEFAKFEKSSILNSFSKLLTNNYFHDASSHLGQFTLEKI